MERQYEALSQLADDVEKRMLWYNHIRPHFGAINRGLTPGMVAHACAGLDFDAREAVLLNLREGTRWKNRAEWQRQSIHIDDTEREPDAEDYTA